MLMDLESCEDQQYHQVSSLDQWALDLNSNQHMTNQFNGTRSKPQPNPAFVVAFVFFGCPESCVSLLRQNNSTFAKGSAWWSTKSLGPWRWIYLCRIQWLIDDTHLVWMWIFAGAKSPPPKVPEVVFTVDKARLWKPSMFIPLVVVIWTNLSYSCDVVGFQLYISDDLFLGRFLLFCFWTFFYLVWIRNDPILAPYLFQEEERRRAERAKRFAPRAASFEAGNFWSDGRGGGELYKVKSMFRVKMGDVFRKLTIWIAPNFGEGKIDLSHVWFLWFAPGTFVSIPRRPKKLRRKQRRMNLLRHRCQEGRFLDTWKTMEISLTSCRHASWTLQKMLLVVTRQFLMTFSLRGTWHWRSWSRSGSLERGPLVALGWQWKHSDASSPGADCRVSYGDAAAQPANCREVSWKSWCRNYVESQDNLKEIFQNPEWEMWNGNEGQLLK